MNNRSGYLKQNLSGKFAYKSFVPSCLPPMPSIDIDSNLMGLLIEAHRKLSVLNEKASSIPNMNLFIYMYIRKEALLSSQIEGTQATLEDIFDPKLDVNANRDAGDVVSYIKATDYALNMRDDLPLCNRYIKQVHEVLMDNVRGKDKYPGEFRVTQNWIGDIGSTLNNASYIPPEPQDMTDAMSDLEKYINTDDDLDVLIRCALIHYQFETIHPFIDGNGRIGRLLITLYMMEKDVLKSPAIYVSYFLKNNRFDYYNRMTQVRKTGDYEQWVKFFITALIESVKDALDTIEALNALHDKNAQIVSTFGRSTKNALRILRYLETAPIIEISMTAKALELSFNAISNNIDRLIKAGILVATDDSSRNRTFVYKEYLDILKRGT